MALSAFSQDVWRTKVEQIYLYTQEGKNDKADKLFNQLLHDLPDNRNTIVNISALFRNKALYDYAMAVLDTGAKNNTEHDPLYMEKATLCQAINNYSDSFEYYLLELERKPDKYNTVKSRFSTMLLYDVNKSIADEMRIALLKKTQEKPNNNEYAALLIWFAIQEEDYEIALNQCLSLDRRNNDQDQQIVSLADICYNNGQFELAKTAYDHVLKKGKINPFYGTALIGSINAENQILKNNPATSDKSYEKLSVKIGEAYSEVGSKEYPGLTEIQADIMTYRLGQSDQAIALLQQAIEQTVDKNQVNQLKLKLADIYLYNDEVWEATLLYSQVDKAMKEAPMGHEARFRNAQLRYFIGEFAWAETQLNVLKAATSKLIANDAMSLALVISDNLEADTTGAELRRLARADFKIYQQKDSQALPILDSVSRDGNEISKPHALYRIAEIQEKNMDFVKADSLYLQIVNEFPDSYMADDALMRAALLEDQQLRNKEAAKQHYEQLIDQYPTSLYTAQAKKNYRKL
jgi:tetratricopeptide (TPR) repeat protein